MKLNLESLAIELPTGFDDITDFFLPVRAPLQGFSYPGPQPLALKNGPLQALLPIILSACEQALLESGRPEFTLELLPKGSVQGRILFRGHAMEALEGRVIVLRRLPNRVPRLHDLQIPHYINEVL